MIKRERYLEQIRPFYDSDLIKIISGIKGCGHLAYIYFIPLAIKSAKSKIEIPRKVK